MELVDMVNSKFTLVINIGSSPVKSNFSFKK